MKARGEFNHLIPVAHPNLHRVGKVGEHLSRSAVASFDLQGSATKFSRFTPLNNTTQRTGHPLHSVADSKHRNA